MGLPRKCHNQQNWNHCTFVTTTLSTALQTGSASLESLFSFFETSSLFPSLRRRRTLPHTHHPLSAMNHVLGCGEKAEDISQEAPYVPTTKPICCLRLHHSVFSFLLPNENEQQLTFCQKLITGTLNATPTSLPASFLPPLLIPLLPPSYLPSFLLSRTLQ